MKHAIIFTALGLALVMASHSANAGAVKESVNAVSQDISGIGKGSATKGKSLLAPVTGFIDGVVQAVSGLAGNGVAAAKKL